ncbi:MAG: hypothetical protein JXA94_03875 [Parachlamydiales bacterium]|nr:hypothetical protein [Parachlamydiales bacterium]
MAKSRKYEDRRPIGDAILEFYSALDKIEEYYTKKGYRKITMLHKVLKEELNWEMPYDTFRYHFNKEFGSKAKSSSLNEDPKDKPVNNQVLEESPAPETNMIQEEPKTQIPKEETTTTLVEDTKKGPIIGDSSFGQVQRIRKNTRNARPKLGR